MIMRRKMIEMITLVLIRIALLAVIVVTTTESEPLSSEACNLQLEAPVSRLPGWKPNGTASGS